MLESSVENHWLLCASTRHEHTGKSSHSMVLMLVMLSNECCRRKAKIGIKVLSVMKLISNMFFCPSLTKKKHIRGTV